MQEFSYVFSNKSSNILYFLHWEGRFVTCPSSAHYLPIIKDIPKTRNINIAYWAGYKPALPVTVNRTGRNRSLTVNYFEILQMRLQMVSLKSSFLIVFLKNFRLKRIDSQHYLLILWLEQ